MDSNDNVLLRNSLIKDFGVDLPILSGSGHTIDDPIVIDPNYKDWSDVEYTFLKYINLALNRSWKIVQQSLLEHNGRKIDQLKIEITGDDKNYYNYYFDVTDHI